MGMWAFVVVSFWLLAAPSVGSQRGLLSLRDLLARVDPASARSFDAIADRLTRAGLQSQVLSGYGEAPLEGEGLGGVHEEDPSLTEADSEDAESPRPGFMFSLITELPQSWHRPLLKGLSKVQSLFEVAQGFVKGRLSIGEEEQDTKAAFLELAALAVKAGGNPPAMILLAEASLLAHQEEWPGTVAEMLRDTRLRFNASELGPESWRQGCFSRLASQANRGRRIDPSSVGHISLSLVTHTDSLLLLALGVCFAQADLEEYGHTAASKIMRIRRTLPQITVKGFVNATGDDRIESLFLSLEEDLLLTQRESADLFVELQKQWQWEARLLGDADDENDVAWDIDIDEGIPEEQEAERIRQRIERSLQARESFESSIPTQQQIWASSGTFTSLESIPAVERVSYLERTMAFDVTIAEQQEVVPADEHAAAATPTPSSPPPQAASEQQTGATNSAGGEVMLDEDSDGPGPGPSGAGVVSPGQTMVASVGLPPELVESLRRALNRTEETTAATTAPPVSPTPEPASAEQTAPLAAAASSATDTAPMAAEAVAVGADGQVIPADTVSTTTQQQQVQPDVVPSPTDADVLLAMVVESLQQQLGLTFNERQAAALKKRILAAVMPPPASNTPAPPTSTSDDGTTTATPPRKFVTVQRSYHVEYSPLTVGKAMRADLWMPGLLRLRKFYEHGLTLLSLLHLARIRMSRAAVERAFDATKNGSVIAHYDMAELFAAEVPPTELFAPVTTTASLIVPSEKPFLLIFIDTFVDVVPRLLDTAMDTVGEVLDAVFTFIFEGPSRYSSGSQKAAAAATAPHATSTPASEGTAEPAAGAASAHSVSNVVRLAQPAIQSLVEDSLPIFSSDDETKEALLHLSSRQASGYWPFDPENGPSAPGANQRAGFLPEEEHKFFYENHLSQLYYGMHLGDKLPLTKGDKWRALADAARSAAAAASSPSAVTITATTVDGLVGATLSAESGSLLGSIEVAGIKADAEEDAFLSGHSIQALLRKVSFRAAVAGDSHSETASSLARCNAAADSLLRIAQDAVSDSRVSSAGNPLTSFPSLWEANEDASIFGAVGEEGQNVQYLRHLADEEGDVDAAFQLGELLIHGYPQGGVRPDVPAAMRLLERAADAGNMEARGQLGMLLLDRYLGPNGQGNNNAAGADDGPFDGGEEGAPWADQPGFEEAHLAAAGAALDGINDGGAAVDGGGGADAFPFAGGFAGDAAFRDDAQAPVEGGADQQQQPPPHDGQAAADIGGIGGGGAGGMPAAFGGVGGGAADGRGPPAQPPDGEPALPDSSTAGGGAGTGPKLSTPRPPPVLDPVAGNVTLAKRYLEEAAAGGSAQAHAGLGFLFMVGCPSAGIRKNNSLALIHLRKAADAGYPNAHSNAAAILLNGVGAPGRPPVPPDGLPSDDVAFNATAARWHLEQAVVQMEYLPAIFNIATIDWYGWEETPEEQAKMTHEELALKRCRGALSHWMNVALRGRWIHDSAFNFKSAFELYKRGKLGEQRRHGITALLQSAFENAVGGSGGDFKVDNAESKVAATEVPFTGSIQRSLMHYLLLSSFGISQSMDNAAFLLRQYTPKAVVGDGEDKTHEAALASSLVVMSMLDPIAILLNPLNDTLPGALAFDSDSHNHQLLATLKRAQEQRQGGGVDNGALAGFVFGGLTYAPPQEEAEAAPSPALPSVNTHQNPLPVLASQSLTQQLSLLSARIGSGFGAAQMGKCYSERWQGAVECRHGMPLPFYGATNTSYIVNSTALVAASVTAGVESHSPQSQSLAAQRDPPFIEWYHVAADLGHAHSVFELANEASKTNVTLAWELLYRVAALDVFFGEWPVAVTRIRIIFTWFFSNVYGAFMEVVSELERTAASTQASSPTFDLASWLQLPIKLWDTFSDRHHGPFYELSQFFGDVFGCADIVLQDEFVREASLWSPSLTGADNLLDVYSANEYLDSLDFLAENDSEAEAAAAAAAAANGNKDETDTTEGQHEEQPNKPSTNGEAAAPKPNGHQQQQQPRKSAPPTRRSSYSSAVRNFNERVMRQQQLEEELNGEVGGGAGAGIVGGGGAAADDHNRHEGGGGVGDDWHLVGMAKRLVAASGLFDEDQDEARFNEGLERHRAAAAAAAGGGGQNADTATNLPLHERVARSLHEDVEKRARLASELRYRLGPWRVHAHDMFLCYSAVDSFRFAIFLATLVVFFGILGAVGCGQVIVRRTVLAIRLRQAHEANLLQPLNAREEAREEMMRQGS
jgi:TPR repeat protein